MTPRIGILLSGSGSTYANIATHIAEGTIAAEIAVVVASRADAGGLQRAASLGHPHTVAQQSDAINAILADHQCQWVLLCGFMRRFDAAANLQGKVLNVHPSLLPSFGGKGFYGDRVHQAVLDHGCRVSGCSVHLVEGDYDTGPILAQRCVAVRPNDTVASLRQRVQAAERHLYPLVVRSILSHGIHGEGRQRWLSAVAGCDPADFGFAAD
ncbi:MAG: phosphoribosylglycinamide formyltransferase [Planctomycetota bacterium]|nr:MAG: phosphoribosylglycinamide formyltransferase [Planctomycetota bacterium]